MYKKTISYEDFNGNERKDDFYFHLSEIELTEMQLSVEGGFAETITKISEAQDTASLIKLLKEIIIKSYGVKSEDGLKFRKNETITQDFIDSPAFSALFMELATDEKAAAEFINKIVPSNIAKKMAANNNDNNTVTKIP